MTVKQESIIVIINLFFPRKMIISGGVVFPPSTFGRLFVLYLIAAAHPDLCSSFLITPSSSGSVVARTTTAAAAAASSSTTRNPFSSSSPSSTKQQQETTTTLSSKQSNEIVGLLLQELDKVPQNEAILAEYMSQLEKLRQPLQKTEKTAGGAASSSKSGSSSKNQEKTASRSDSDDDSNSSNDNSNRFERLLGLYDVSFVKTTRSGDNPVGGKWTRQSGLAQWILQTRRTFQHILPVNSTGCGALFACYTNTKNVDNDKASSNKSSSSSSSSSRIFRAVVGEAVNVISLDALWGLLRLTVILRGDAIPLSEQERNSSNCFQPLSPLAVRALFDAPRIVLGKTGRFFNVNIGPKTSVILDALHVDDRIRIGLGGRSGTRFIFKRCSNGDDKEANEFRRLLAKRPMKKFKVLTALTTIAGFGLYSAFCTQPPPYYYYYSTSGGAILLRRLLSAGASLLAAALGALIAFSGGGIEGNDQSVVS
jgi:hypothetical protein